MPPTTLNSEEPVSGLQQLQTTSDLDPAWIVQIFP